MKVESESENLNTESFQSESLKILSSLNINGSYGQYASISSCSSSNISDGVLKNTDFPVRPFNGVNEGWLGSFSCFGRSMHQWLAITTLLLTPANGSVYYHVVWYGFYGI